jgi:hypothetical protein
MKIEPYANLEGADLYNADLSGADLYNADLSGADLSGADLSGAYLYGADLSGANLYGANLYGSNPRFANLRGANLKGAKNFISVGPTSDGYIFYGVKHKDCVMIKAGCRWFSTKEARVHWKTTRADTPLGKERLRFVKFIEKYFKGA